MGSENDDAVFRHLGSHIVSIVCTYIYVDSAGKPKGAQEGVSFSGFVITLDGKWYVITAGHILGEKFGDAVTSGRIRVVDCKIADYFGQGAKNQTPTAFSWTDTPKFHVDKDDLGLDIGAFRLSDLHVAGLQSNGVKAIPEAQWTEGNRENAQLFLILGFPTEEKRFEQTGDSVVEYVRPCMAGVTPCDPPEDSPETTYPRFAGRLLSDEPKNMDGFSGGPIFRYRIENGARRFWLFGVQAAWRDTLRITFGCPMTFVAERIRAHKWE